MKRGSYSTLGSGLGLGWGSLGLAPEYSNTDVILFSFPFVLKKNHKHYCDILCMIFMTHRNILIRKIITTGEDTYKLYSLFSNPYASYDMLCDMYVTKFEINIV